ncbi:hypothetical protein ACLEEZ_05635 [Lonsdalea quercina]|uniref:hypothetical protein n=1 Tax=Lonsdalea quercina TaxID=71657 RepID=UPI003975D2AA
MRRYIVFAFKKEGIRGGHQDIYGFADTIPEVIKLTVDAKHSARINPNVIEVYDSKEEALINLYAINSEGNWIEHELND